VPVAAIAGVVALAGIGASVATGGLATSSMALTNASSDELIVRFTVPGQYASFGYRLASGASAIGWADEPGSERGRLVVYAADCRYLYDIEATPLRGIGWSVGEGAATELEAQPSGAPFLAYDSSCALELRVRREAAR
jgi:hypothetical protein